MVINHNISAVFPMARFQMLHLIILWIWTDIWGITVLSKWAVIALETLSSANGLSHVS